MGRYDIKAGPKCTHARKGRVEAGDLMGIGASTIVCDRPACIADAKEWATALTHEEAVWIPDRPKTGGNSGNKG